MPHLSQRCTWNTTVVNLARRKRQACPIFLDLLAIDISPGLIFPQSFFAGAGGTHPPPNLTTNLKEKR
jgi:hypothetical protein